MSLLGKIFPETLFPRKLSADAEQRLRLSQARAEEALVRTHVENALMFIEALAPEASYERALDIYVRELGVPDPLANIIATRALVALGECPAARECRRGNRKRHRRSDAVANPQTRRFVQAPPRLSAAVSRSLLRTFFVQAVE